MCVGSDNKINENKIRENKSIKSKRRRFRVPLKSVTAIILK